MSNTLTYITLKIWRQAGPDAPGRFEHYVIEEISDPARLTVEEADALFLPEEPVLGVEIAGEAVAYSLWHLDRHEIVNDLVGGRPIAATW